VQTRAAKSKEVVIKREGAAIGTVGRKWQAEGRRGWPKFSQNQNWTLAAPPAFRGGVCGRYFESRESM